MRLFRVLIGLALIAALSGCGVTSLAMRAADIGYGEHVPSTVPLHLETAPAHHAIVNWQGLSLSCGRVTDLETTTDHYAWTTVTKAIMAFFAVSEGVGGTALLVKGSTSGSTNVGIVMLSDAALTMAEVFLFKRRHYRTVDRGYGLAYRCDERDGIAVGGRTVPMSTGLTDADRAAVLDDLAQGKPLQIVVDRKVLSIPPDAAERCAALGSERAAADPACAATAGVEVVPVFVTLGRAASIVRMPLVPPPPSTTAPTTAATGAP